MLINRRTLMKSMLAAGIALPFAGVTGLAAADDKTLRIGLSTYPPTLSPGSGGGYAAQAMWALMHRGLLAYTPAGELTGELAESWARDGETAWVFKLREARFSDDSPVTSADVKWSIERMADEKTKSVLRPSFLSIVAIEIPDEKTVRLVTKAPNVALPDLFANQSVCILKKDSNAEKDYGIGAGAFVLDTFEKDVSLDFKATGHYFKPGFPKVDRVRVTVYKDENLRVAALMAGDVDFIDYVPWHAMTSIETQPGLALDVESSGALMYLLFNGPGPFADARLRKAVAFAIRRDEIVKGVFYDRGAELTGMPRAKVSPFHHDEIASYWRYDPDYAKSLMKEAGVPNGFKCTLLSTAQFGMHRDTAVLVQGHLAEIGIEVTLNMPDWPTRLQMGIRGECDFAVMGLGIETLDPDAVTRITDPSLPGSADRSRGFEVPGLSDLLARGKQEFDPEKRQQIYLEADRLVLEHTSYCGLTYRATGFARRSQVAGFEMLPGLLSALSMGGLDKVSIAA